MFWYKILKSRNFKKDKIDMKRKDILISLAIIVACIGILYLYSFTNSLVHGYIKIDSDNSIVSMKLHGNFFSRDIEITGNNPVKINTRILSPRYLTISKTQDSNSIQLISYGPWGDLSRIKIKNNETLSLKVGPPFIIRPSVKKQPGLVSIGIDIIGQAGESYSIPRLPKAPKVKIMDENGKIVNSGSFSYG